MKFDTLRNVKEYFSKDFILNTYSQTEHYKETPSFLSHLKKSDKILDIGCSSGGFDKILFEKGVEILGIDVSEKAIKRAKEINKNYKKAKFLVKDISKWRSEEKFDYILGLFNLLGFISPKEGRIKALDNMFYMLKDKGRIYLTFTAFNFKILIKSIYYYWKNKLLMKDVEFWDTWNYHPKVDIPVFKHNLFPHELKKMLKTLRRKYNFGYEFQPLDKTNFLLVIQSFVAKKERMK